MNEVLKKSMIECEHLSRHFIDGERRISVLDGINLKIAVGETVAIVGPSGSGKTTLLHLLGGLDKPDVGKVIINGKTLNQLSEKELCHLRNRELGFIYQFHHLLPEFTAIENVMIPLMIQGVDVQGARIRAAHTLSQVGLSKRLTHKPSQLSGGERQRTAIARALVTNPLCVFADEPTGNLDQETAETIYETLFNLNRASGTSFVIATHDMNLASRMDHIYRIEHGKITRVSSNDVLLPNATAHEPAHCLQ